MKKSYNDTSVVRALLFFVVVKAEMVDDSATSPQTAEKEHSSEATAANESIPAPAEDSTAMDQEGNDAASQSQPPAAADTELEQCVGAKHSYLLLTREDSTMVS